MSSIGASLITGGAGLLGNILGMSSQSSANRQNVKLAREQREWSEHMVDKQNAYNSPVQQMARYQAAGLNPNLIYSQGTPGNQSNLPTAQAPKVAPVTNSLGDVANNALAAASMVTAIDQQRAQTKAMEQQTQMYQYESMMKSLGVQKGLIDLQTYADRNLEELKRLRSSNRMSEQQYTESVSRVARMKFDMDMAAKRFSIEQGRYDMERELFPLRHQNQALLNTRLGLSNELSGIDLHNYKTYGIPAGSPWYARTAVNLFDKYVVPTLDKLFDDGLVNIPKGKDIFNIPYDTLKSNKAKSVIKQLSKFGFIH